MLSGISAALEAAFDHAGQKGALVLLTGYQTSGALRGCGQARLTRWLAARGVRHAETVSAIALTAVHAQHIQLRGRDRTRPRASPRTSPHKCTAAASARPSTSSLSSA